MVLVSLFAQIDMEHTASICLLFKWCVNILRWRGDHSRMRCVHSRMSCDHYRTGCVHSTHARRRWRLHCAFTAHLLRNVCSAIARRFFLTCSKFDGARSARGVCLTHLGDSTVYVWRTLSVNEDPRAYVAYVPRICYFFVRRASAIASPSSGTGAYNEIGHIALVDTIWCPIVQSLKIEHLYI